MLKENEDLCSVLHPKTAFETLLTLQLLESGENGGRHYCNAGLSVSRRGRGLSNVMSHSGENQNRLPRDTDLI